MCDLAFDKRKKSYNENEWLEAASPAAAAGNGQTDENIKITQCSILKLTFNLIDYYGCAFKRFHWLIVQNVTQCVCLEKFVEME